MRKKEGDKRTSILDAAIRVFAREGFDRAQISAIAADAGIGTGSVYLYFPNKEGILYGIFERFWKRMLEAQKALPAEDPREHLVSQLRLLFDSLSSDRGMLTLYLRESHRHMARPEAPGNREREAALALGEDTYSEGVVAGCFRGGLPMGLARSFVFGGIRSALAWWLDPRESLRNEDAEDSEALRSNPEAFREMAVQLAVSVLLPEGGILMPTEQGFQ